MIDIRALTETDAASCAAIHAQSFETGWNAAEIKTYIGSAATALGAYDKNALLGFILMGAVTDQTDIITIAVSPATRGKGIGRKLVRAAEIAAAARGAEIVFLEVAEDNAAAIVLYKGAGYQPIGKRKNYYRRKGGRVSAITMSKKME